MASRALSKSHPLVSGDDSSLYGVALVFSQLLCGLFCALHLGADSNLSASVRPTATARSGFHGYRSMGSL